MKKSLFRLRHFYFASLVFLSSLSQAKANATPGFTPYIFLADAGSDISGALGSVLALIEAVGFLIGVVVVMNGWREKSRGEEGDMKIIGGVMMGASAIIMRWAFAKFGIGGSSLTEGAI